MFGKLRDWLNEKPWIGWAVAGALLVLSLVLYFSRTTGASPYAAERLAEMVTIKCVETGEEWTMQRALMERALRHREGTLDPAQGLPNPKTGRLTGFPFNKSEWERTVERIERERQLARERHGRKG